METNTLSSIGRNAVTDKHTSLLHSDISYKRRKFYSTGFTFESESLLRWINFVCIFETYCIQVLQWWGGNGGGGLRWWGWGVWVGGVIISDKETVVLFTTLGLFIVSLKVSRLKWKMILDLWLWSGYLVWRQKPNISAYYTYF
jgi:hypothetical protein